MAYYNYSDGTKSSSYKIQKQSKPESKDSTIKDLLISLGIIALLILGLIINTELTASIFFISLMLSPLIYGLYKLFRLLFQAIKETPKKKKNITASAQERRIVTHF